MAALQLIQISPDGFEIFPAFVGGIELHHSLCVCERYPRRADGVLHARSRGGHVPEPELRTRQVESRNLVFTPKNPMGLDQRIFGGGEVAVMHERLAAQEMIETQLGCIERQRSPPWQFLPATLRALWVAASRRRRQTAPPPTAYTVAA